jgi:hypothetical protein
MNRNTEYESLLRELESPPAALDGCVERAQARLRARRRRRRILGSGRDSGGLFAGFVLLLNCFPPLPTPAAACPAAELAKAVARSPASRLRGECYVQHRAKQTVNGITARSTMSSWTKSR